MSAPIIPGAEPLSTDGGPHGALVVHGFTGNPVSMRPVAEALADAGFAVEMPLLPGHGTAVDDMLDTTFADWYGAAEDAYRKLADRVPGKVVAVGLSMGGAVVCELATRHPDLAGVVAVNALVSEPEGARDLIGALLEAGEETMDAIGADIADPDADEKAYDKTPLRALRSLLDAAGDLGGRLDAITCPVLVLASRQDHTVPPDNSEKLAAGVGGEAELVWLEQSYHVATLDLDADEVLRRTVAFAQRVTTG